MSNYEKWLRRVRERADHLGVQLRSLTNAPIEAHIDRTSLEGLLDTFSIDPESVTQDDLARIYIAREGFRNLLDDAHDLDEYAEFSISQISTAMDGLYVEADALLRSQDAFVRGIIRTVEEQKDSNRLPISSAGAIGQTLIKASDEVVSSVAVSRNAIDIAILHSNQIDVLHNLRVSVRRLSATAFVIKVLLNSSVVYDATIKFLNDGADRVLADIKELALALDDSFASKGKLVESVDEVVKKGTRFVKLVGTLITSKMEPSENHREVSMVLRNAFRSPTILCSTATKEYLFLGGRLSIGAMLQPNGQILSEKIDMNGSVLSAAQLADGRFALGTGSGLFIWAPRHLNLETKRSSMSEQIVGVVTQTYNLVETVVTASIDGGLRRWWMPAGNLEQLRDRTMARRDVQDKVGRKIKALLDFDGRLVVAVDNKLSILHYSFEKDWEIALPQAVEAACVVNSRQIAVVGKGMVAIVNFADGRFSQSHGVPDHADYIAVTKLTDTMVAVATPHGKVRAIDVVSGAELGEVAVDFQVRGLNVVGRYLVAYGGDWHRDGNSIALVLWEDKAGLVAQTISRGE